MKNSKTVFVGWITMFAGVMAVAQIILIVMMFTVSWTPYGLLSDFAYMLTPVLMLPALIALSQHYKRQHYAGSLVALISGILGVGFQSIYQVLFITEVISYNTTLYGHHYGYGFIGVAILIFSLYGRENSALKRGFVIFSIILGVTLAMNLISAIFYMDEVIAKTANPFGKGVNDFLFVFFDLLSGLAVNFGVLVWLFMLGREFLRGKITPPGAKTELV